MSNTFVNFDLQNPREAFIALTRCIPQRFLAHVVDDDIVLHRYDRNEADSHFEYEIKKITNASQFVRDNRGSTIPLRQTQLDSVTNNLNSGVSRLLLVAQQRFNELFDQSLSAEQRLKTYRDLLRIFDSTYNAIRKYDEFTDTNSKDYLKRFENFRVEFRNNALETFVLTQPTRLDRLKKMFKFKKGEVQPPTSIEKLLLFEIARKNIQAGNSSSFLDEDLTSDGINFVEDREGDYTKNCQHVSIAIFAVENGGATRASGIDRSRNEVPVTNVLQNLYGKPWEDLQDFDELFDMIESDEWPIGKSAFLLYQYKPTSSHVTIVNKFIDEEGNPRAYIREGQTTAIKTRTSRGNFRQVSYDVETDQFHAHKIEDRTYKFVRVLEAEIPGNVTANEMATETYYGMYPDRRYRAPKPSAPLVMFEDDDMTVDAPVGRANKNVPPANMPPQRQWFVEAPIPNPSRFLGD